MLNWPKKLTIDNWVSVISAFIAVVAVVFTYSQYQLTRQQLRLHIEPNLDIKLTTHLNGYYQPVLSVRNLSPINISSLRANFLIFHFKKSRREFVDIWSSLKSDQTSQASLMFSKKLEPNDACSAELGNVISRESGADTDNIFVYVVFLVFFRESDLKRFDVRKIYFFENGKTFENRDFLAHPDYYRIIETINLGDPPQFDNPILQSNRDKEKATNPQAPPPPSGIKILH